MAYKMRKAIFLDRDGTLNHDNGYTYRTEDFKLLPDVIPALKLLKDKFVLFIITNQSGVARGYYTLGDVARFHNHMIGEFEKEGIKIEEIYVCPHSTEDNCDCRKPSTKLIELAKTKHSLDIQNSYVIGDHPFDIEMGIKAGCKTIYVLTGHGMKHIIELNEKGIQPTLITNNLYDALRWIEENE
jgi:histidinol-phosphate phosphatase family protein